jgi:hypothetical protein
MITFFSDRFITIALLMLIKDLFDHVSDFLESLENCRIKMFRHGPSITLCYNPERLLMVKGRFVRSLTPQRIILIYEHDYPALNRRFYSVETSWITPTVPSFVMIQGNGGSHLNTGIG